MQAGPVNEALKPLCWLIGKWKSVCAKGQYPTIKPFTYCEEMEFISVGQPMLNYKSVTWHPEKKNPMHLESGFLRIKPGTNQLAFMVGHNFGITTLEEGTVGENCLDLKTTAIGRMCFAKDPAVTEVTRHFQYCPESQHLQAVVCMATCNTPLTEHLRITYEKSC
ncbi:hypothetical protein ILUMI_03298 [Ignelater luminosus]|uniref:THAP4-like heme-binding domain-containing protein n=1 Tax=Ignelater luminosus TaxID=2038154 RepID=A0A8K0DGJ6_IGNLU|nr:hypothetical protein ILUMI_03298 [Ignelater luminosus]